MSKRRRGVALCLVTLLPMLWVASVQAQVLGGGWSEPYLLSSGAGKASEGFLAADQYGYIHVLWVESLLEAQHSVIRYARFEGQTWSIPNEIHVTDVGIKNVSPVVDRHGTLHIAWAEGLNGPAYYTRAPANSALAAQNWSRPIRINIPARTIHLRVDSRDVFHILYINQIEAPGVYYIRSEDQGATWSKPVWLDPDILPNHIPDSLNFELDEADGLHATWFYGGLDQSARPDWVRYTHSLDGGNTWSAPFMIDQYVQEGNHNLTFASPRMIVQGQTVHVIWAAGGLPYRYHRFSSDAGQTWSAPRQIFGKLHGQAFDGLAVDRANRVHFLGQIRYPMGIYSAYWDQTHWSSPSLIYLIDKVESVSAPGGPVHAHFTHPIVRAGNQLVVTFTDGPADPNRRLFAIHRTLDDIPPVETVPTPVSASSPTPSRQATMPAPAATVLFVDTPTTQPLRRVPRPDSSIWVALIPTALLLGGTLVFRWLGKSKH